MAFGEVEVVRAVVVVRVRRTRPIVADRTHIVDDTTRARACGREENTLAIRACDKETIHRGVVVIVLPFPSAIIY